MRASVATASVATASAAAGTERPKAPAPRPRERLKGVGLTLSGGGILGLGSMAGFASAVDLLLISHDVTDLESYAGVSAGALLASFLAAGISPHDFIRAYVAGDDSAFGRIRRRDIFRPNWSELATTPVRLARAVAGGVRRLLRRGGGVPDGAPPALGILPSALFRNDRLAEGIRRNLERHGGNDFRKLPGRLAVSFYDLLRNEEVVSGSAPGEIADVPVHEAVAASAAIPGVFTPRRIRYDGRTMLGIDGGSGGVSMTVGGADRLDVLFAYNCADWAEVEEVGHASALAIVGLTLRLLFNQRNVHEIARFMDAHPRCHVLLFESEPEPDLGSKGLSFAAAFDAVRPSFERTKKQLAERLDYLALALEPRGVKLNPEIGSADFDEVVAKGRRAKEELRKRHGLA